jgi:hypothetical protein
VEEKATCEFVPFVATVPFGLPEPPAPIVTEKVVAVTVTFASAETSLGVGVIVVR